MDLDPRLLAFMADRPARTRFYEDHLQARRQEQEELMRIGAVADPGPVERVDVELPATTEGPAVPVRLFLPDGAQGTAPEGTAVPVRSFLPDDAQGTAPEGPAVPVRLSLPDGAQGTASPEQLPCILYLHGGAFVVGSVAASDATCARLCHDLGAVVVSVEYRLAPEFPYPAGLDDAYRALLWVAATGCGGRVRSSRIAVMGTSAGGGLAAGLALLARDRSGPRIALQVLDQPVLDDRCETPSSQEITVSPTFDRAAQLAMWRLYLPDPGGPSTPIYAAPSRARDLRELPAAVIVAAEHDPLRDEAVSYAQALRSASVQADLLLVEGACHGFGAARTVPLVRQHHQQLRGILREALHAR